MALPITALITSKIERLGAAWVGTFNEKWGACAEQHSVHRMKSSTEPIDQLVAASVRRHVSSIKFESVLLSPL